MARVNRWKRYGRAGAHAALALILSLVLSLPCLQAQGPAAEKGKEAAGSKAFLADRHKARGLDCSACHKESPPKAAPSMAICLKCHGPYDKLAARTEKAEHNPHASHMGELDCVNCHHGHKPSVDYCAGCHSFGLKVP